MKKVILSRIKVNRVKCIGISFPYDKELIRTIKQIKGARWKPERKLWYIKEDEENVKKIKEIFRNTAIIEYTEESVPATIDAAIRLGELNEEDEQDLHNFRKYMEHKRYSESTIDSYNYVLAIFFRFCKPANISEIKPDMVIKFVNEYIAPMQLSFTFQNHLVSALKLFYSTIYKAQFDCGMLERPRRESKLPNVLSMDEVKRILLAISNIKQRLMIAVIYACGLRRSELLRLEPEDIISNRGLLRIRGAKGNKERYVPIPEELIKDLRMYYKSNRPKRYLFEGQTPGKPYSTSSLSSIIKNAAKRAGIKRKVSLHWLRHSYATHQLERGVDLRYIQEILGHKSSRTTEIYTHVSEDRIGRIESPYTGLLD